MTYSTCEIALKAILLEMTSTFKTGDVTLTDYRTLDSGLDATHGPNKAILRPGGVTSEMVATLVSGRVWGILIDLFTAYQQDDDWADFKATRELMVRKLETHQVLNILDGSVNVTMIASEDDPLEVFDKSGAGPFFITQRFRLTVEERVS
jgi:hypothetical protein